MWRTINYLLFFFFLLHFLIISAIAKNKEEELISLHIKHVPLKEALYAIAKTMHQDILMSEAITAFLTLDINHMPPKKLLNLIALKYGLKWEEIGDLLIVTTAKEWMQQKERLIREEMLNLETSPLQLHILTLRYAKALDLATLLRADTSNHLLSKRGQLHIDARTNSLLIHDTATSVALIKQMISKLDQPLKQILIEARLVSMDDDSERELGLSLLHSANGETDAAIPIKMGKWNIAESLDIKLSLLQKKGHADILASPRLFTSDQETASIETGEEVPYQESGDNGGTTVSFKKAVLGLKITPHILPGGRILLNLQLNHDRAGTRLVQGMPTITTRQITTSVILRNKETVILGGIYETDNERGTTGLIGINDIPILGHLFTRRVHKQHKRELLIFVTPRIMTYS